MATPPGRGSSRRSAPSPRASGRPGRRAMTAWGRQPLPPPRLAQHPLEPGRKGRRASQVRASPCMELPPRGARGRARLGPTAIIKVPTKEATGRRTMMKGRTLIIVLLALGVASVAWAQQPPAQLKFSRIVDLTIPIESHMPGIPGIKTYADNPSRVDVVTAITEAQKSQLPTQGRTLNH